MKIIGLIPARAGSKRIPGKNMALLAGKPLLQYAVESALETGAFRKIVVSTNWDRAEAFVRNKFSGVEVLMRPEKLCTDSAHDYEWVKHALDNFPGFDIFVVLRPTNPFRTADTIRSAFAVLDTCCDSVRAVERTSCHPHKSWRLIKDGLEAVTNRQLYRLSPLYQVWFGAIGCFDMPTQALPEIYVQNACIQIAYTRTVEKFKNVTGDFVVPYFTRGIEGFDINTPEDLAYAEFLMKGVK